MHRYNSRGQSTVEYILLVTGVIAIAIAFTTGAFRTKLNSTIVVVTNDIGNIANRLSESHQGAGTKSTGSTDAPYTINVKPHSCSKSDPNC